MTTEEFISIIIESYAHEKRKSFLIVKQRESGYDIEDFYNGLLEAFAWLHGRLCEDEITLKRESDGKNLQKINSQFTTTIWPEFAAYFGVDPNREIPSTSNYDDEHDISILLPDSVAKHFLKNRQAHKHLIVLAEPAHFQIKSSDVDIKKNPNKSKNQSNHDSKIIEQKPEQKSEEESKKESEIRETVAEYFAFMLMIDRRKLQKILTQNEYNKLIDWVSYYFINNYSIPQIDSPIKIINTAQGNIVYAFITLFDTLRGKKGQNRPDSLFELIKSCFYQCRNKEIYKLRKATSKPSDYPGLKK